MDWRVDLTRSTRSQIASPPADPRLPTMRSPSFVLLLACVSASCASLPAPAVDASPLVWSSALVPCTPRSCGGVAANAATFRLNDGEVGVTKDGTLSIQLNGPSDAATGAILGGRTLEVWQGVFTNAGFEGGPVNPVGTITTDHDGDYEGSVQMNSGYSFAFTKTCCILRDSASN